LRLFFKNMVFAQVWFGFGRYFFSVAEAPVKRHQGHDNSQLPVGLVVVVVALALTLSLGEIPPQVPALQVVRTALLAEHCTHLFCLFRVMLHHGSA
jgi:hypothetical protein